MSLKDCLWGNNTLWLWNKLKLQGQSIILQNAKCYVKHFRYNIFGVLEENREQMGFSVGCDGLRGQWARQTRVLWHRNRKRKEKKSTSFPWCPICLLLYTFPFIDTCTCKSQKNCCQNSVLVMTFTQHSTVVTRFFKCQLYLLVNGISFILKWKISIDTQLKHCMIINHLDLFCSHVVLL